MKKRDCQTRIEISDADWQRFEKFLPEPESAPPTEVKLVESTLSKVRIPRTGRGRLLCY